VGALRKTLTFIAKPEPAGKDFSAGFFMIIFSTPPFLPV
jgi:hypothetical protein